MANLATLGAVWNYVYGTFRIRRILLLTLVALSVMFTGPLFFRFPLWIRADLAYFYTGTASVSAFCMYGAFKHPVKSLIGSVLLGRKYKAREFTPQEYMAYRVPQIMNEMGIPKRARIYVTSNPWIDGPFTNAFTNKIYLPTSWLRKFPRQDMRGVLGHELGHVRTKRKFDRDFLVGMGGVGVLAFLLGMFAIAVVVTIFEFALVFLVLTAISWRNERRADMEGAKATGPEGLISVFEQLRVESKRDEGSETHPPLSDRITRLSRLLDYDGVGAA